MFGGFPLVFSFSHNSIVFLFLCGGEGKRTCKHKKKCQWLENRVIHCQSGSLYLCSPGFSSGFRICDLTSIVQAPSLVVFKYGLDKYLRRGFICM